MQQQPTIDRRNGEHTEKKVIKFKKQSRRPIDLESGYRCGGSDDVILF